MFLPQERLAGKSGIEVLGRHAPILRKYIKTKRIPWLNASIKQLMRQRDFHKIMFKKINSEMYWEKFKTIRNKINSEIKNLKANYFNTKISECLQDIIYLGKIQNQPLSMKLGLIVM